MKENKTYTTVDITPKWEDLARLYMEWIDYGSKAQKDLVKSEMLKLCKIADRVQDLKINLNA